MTDLIQKFFGKGGPRWLRALKKMLRKENPWERLASDLTVWKTIKLGTCKTPDEYREALRSAGYRISDWGNDILRKTSCAEVETEVDLVALSVKELGFQNGANYKDICARGVEMGFELAPAEVGPALRLSYKDQPRGEWLRIASNRARRGGRHDEHYAANARNDTGRY